MGLEIEALSAVRVGQRLWKRDGDAFLTLIVKATFAYEPGRDAWLVEPEPLSLEIAEDTALDPLLRRAARAARATELAPNLRRAGVSVLGFACAPSGTMAREIDLRLAVLRGPPQQEEALVDKRLHVLGDRQSADAFPDPFEAIPLVDELCFGGPSDPSNPRGVGVGEAASTLPNILPIDRSARFANVGPLPIARTSPLFTSLDQALAEIRTDGDWDAFQSAPPDQRLMGMREFFSGDERVVMEGMDRRAPRIDLRLPRVRALARWVRAGRGPRVLELRGDCLVIDADARRLSLTWRGQIPAPSDPSETVRAAVALAFGEERDDEAAAWPADLQTLGVTGQSPAALAALASGARARPATAVGRTLDAAELESARVDTDVGSETLTTGLVFNVSSAEPSWVARGAPRRDERPAAPIPGAPWSQVEAKKVDAAGLGDETFDPPGAESALGRTLPTAVSLLPAVPPLGPPPLAAVAPPLPPAPLAPVPPAPLEWTPKVEVPLTIGALHVAAQQAAARATASEAARAASAASVEPVKSTPPPAATEEKVDPERRPDRVAPLAIDAKPVRGLRAPRESAARADCLTRLEKGASLEGMALAGVDLSGIDFRERSLARAVLTGARLEAANLARCNLTGALLDDADLTEADLTGAILTRADASRAVLVDAKLDRAQLVDAVLEGVNAEGASFRSATGMRTILKGSSLVGAVFASASLDRADFTGATLDRADFTGATTLRGRFDEARATGLVLDGARMNDSRWEGAKLEATEGRGLSAQHSVWVGAVLTGANFEKADLRSAHLRSAKLVRATFTDADLRDVELRDADVTGANFTRANLEGGILTRASGTRATFDGARLSGADARDVVFTEATLKEASCVRARLDGAKLVGADLTRADLRHAWLRDAKLGRADLSQALVDGADLRGADLEGATLYKVDLARARGGASQPSSGVDGGPGGARAAIDAKTK